MRYIKSVILSAMSLAIACSLPAQVNKVNEVPDFKYGENPDWSLMKNAYPTKSNGYAKPAPQQRPDHWNNATLKFFPPIFNQSGPSCMGSAYVGYNFTNETNSFRDADGSLPENQYAVFFNWLLTQFSSNKETMLRTIGDPNMVVYGGRTYSNKFGYCDWAASYFGWMQGYDNWFHTFHNRISGHASFPIDVSREEGREAVKQWVWNHNGDTDFHGGGVCYITVGSGLTAGKIASTPANDETGAVGKNYVITWAEKMDHALTIVGYDDRLEFDLDGNGIYGEKDKDEVGAWIIVNSWGQGWSNGGWIYCPYAIGGVINKGEQPWKPEIMYVRKNYRPLRTFKIKMDFNDRHNMSLAAGIATDTSATKPEATIAFEHFKYVGHTADSIPAYPMLGQWADGIHYEPMEFGYDLTDFSATFDRTKPLKYFFIVNTKKGNDGGGHIYNCSFMDYEFDRNGIEFPFQIDTVDVPCNGKTTMISVIVQGEQLSKPINLAINGNTLTWQAPQATSLKLIKYYICANDRVIDSTDVNTLSYTAGNVNGIDFTVKAVYLGSGGYCYSDASNVARVSTPEQTQKDNDVIVLKNAGFKIPNLFKEGMQQATIEWWFKPYNSVSYNQQIGPGWGQFLFHAKNGGGISFGWNTTSGDRYDGSTSLLTVNSWKHYAITVNGSVMTLFINGSKKATVNAKGYHGLSAMGDFVFGSNGQPINGEIDELRIWNTSRTSVDFIYGKDIEIANPTAQDGLMAYYKMDLIEEDGVTKIRDHAHNLHAIILDEANTQVKTDNSFMKPLGRTQKSYFTFLGDEFYAGTGVDVRVSSPLNTVKWTWNAPDAGIKDLNTQKPQFVFPKPGTFDVTMTVTDDAGVTIDTTRQITIIDAPEPVIDFDIPNDVQYVGDHFSFLNQSQAVNGQYTWSMPGADIPTVNAKNAGAIYNKAGDYKVTLTATGAFGKKSVTKDVHVIAAAPSPRFVISPNFVIKGEKVYFKNLTRYEPTTVTLNLTNGVENTIISGGSSSYTTVSPGYYDVTMFASNDVGSNQVTEKNAFVVANADSKNGLFFTGEQQAVTFDSPIDNISKGITIEWWMQPAKLVNAFLFEAGTFSIGSDSYGRFNIKNGTSTANTVNNSVITSEWHHYAFTLSNSTLIFYRDGEQISRSNLSSNLDLTNAKCAINSIKGFGMNTAVDEFRVWNKAMTLTEIKSYCNQPIEDIEAAEKDGLVLYYNFNQGSGNVTDLTSGKHDGIRTGFGPDGDAWGLSTGVFTLNFETPAKNTDVSRTYLTNYRKPFIFDKEAVNNTNTTRFLKLRTGAENSTWQIENAVQTTDNIITGAYVDAQRSYDLLVTTGNNSFSESLSNHKLYQTVTLPAGTYCFSATSTRTGATPNCYLAVNLGKGLPDQDNIENCLASTPIYDANSSSYTATVEFLLNEETEVSLGVLYSLSNAMLDISAFKLEKKPVNIIDADGIAGIGDAVKRGVQAPISAERGGIRVVSDDIITLKIYDLQGRCVLNEYVSGNRLIPMPVGIYIANGVKVAVTK